MTDINNIKFRIIDIEGLLRNSIYPPDVYYYDSTRQAFSNCYGGDYISLSDIKENRHDYLILKIIERNLFVSTILELEDYINLNQGELQ